MEVVAAVLVAAAALVTVSAAVEVTAEVSAAVEEMEGAAAAPMAPRLSSGKGARFLIKRLRLVWSRRSTEANDLASDKEAKVRARVRVKKSVRVNFLGFLGSMMGSVVVANVLVWRGREGYKPLQNEAGDEEQISETKSTARGPAKMRR